MFKSKNQFKTIFLCLITFISLLFIFHNHQTMAMDNQNNNNINQQTNGDTKLLNLINQRNNLEQQINNAQNNNLTLIEIQALQNHHRLIKRRIILYKNKLNGIPTLRNTN
ncbi:MAG: SVM family protein ['Conium maculatum' witches'-broom phytoplasma]|nr:SVM family protein ['Conium maculatum' witches'-broom phytoplasma]MEC4559001.1 SVM family protein ['Conium maculatum' witches'-broom phytoplasma]